MTFRGAWDSGTAYTNNDVVTDNGSSWIALTATNGVDYAAVPTNITLAAGQISSNINVTPVSEPNSTG